MHIHYTKDTSKITANMLNSGFFAGWPNPPTPDTHLRILQSSYLAYVAIDTKINKVVGFINAISDGVLSAYIPLLETLESHRGNGIGSELVRLMLANLDDLYMIDIAHDENRNTFYDKFNPHRGTLSFFRNYEAQAGKIS